MERIRLDIESTGVVARRVAPGRDPVAGVSTVLADTGRTRVTRVGSPFGTMIRKEALGRSAEQRLRHEVAILEQLAGVEGVVQLADGVTGQPRSILLKDTGGTALSEWRTPLEPAVLISVAEALARAVAGMHHRGVVHRDISPANIVVAGYRNTGDRDTGDRDTGDGDLRLIDFALATTATSVRREFAHHTTIVGTVPYLAPEQTGRTSRPVDHRADLYAVGATLYELATGRPPFGTDDPLRIIHDHLTRLPVPVADLNPAVPGPLSAVIAHLLEKEPDDRYQSAEGLVHDLVLIRRGTPPLHPGAHDRHSRPLAAARPAGREREIDELGAAFRAAAAGHSRSVLVSGPPGVGKTRLVDELRSVVAENDGWFVTGMFDRYRRDQTHNGLLQAVRSLGRLLLAEPEDSLAQLRQRLRQALGPNAGLAAAAVPEVAVLLGVPAAPGNLLTTRARATYAAVEFLRAVASARRPVVCFVDDLQWAGGTPLGILDRVFTGTADIGGLLVVAAYRNNELDGSVPLTALLEQWLALPHRPLHLRLENLPPSAQAALLTDVLRLPPGQAAELARALEPTTHGNPHDTIELLDTLRHEAVLSPGEHGWHWDPETLRRRLDRLAPTDLLTARVATMPRATVDLLAAMACLAGRTEQRALEAATALPADELRRRLAPALAAGTLVSEAGAGAGDTFHLRFSDDRTRESLLTGLTDEARDAIRLRLARNLAGQVEHTAIAAEQYLPVVDALGDTAERQAVAALLRRAADEEKVLSNHTQVEALLTAVVRLIDPADVDALLAEEAARFYLAHGLDMTGQLLLVGTRRVYAAWGAAAKVGLLDWSSPGLRTAPAEELLLEQPKRRSTDRSVVTTGTIDLRGIVSASRALSSETSVDGLRAKVVGILSRMTGATDVHLLVRDEECETWLVSTGAGGALPLREAGARHLLPPSLVWYAERTREPVVVTDAATDDRFRRDPSFGSRGRCSLLAIPVTIRGRLRAMLLLENRMIRHAFSADRLEGIMLVAGQLAVSLDNALMYASLERKVAERTRQLADANRQLRRLSVTDPLTGLANRRRLDEILDLEWRRARLHGTPLALAMVDIDHFKLYNDCFGHSAGDHCLQMVAHCLAHNLSDPQVAARYGGEEFAIVMPGTDAAAAARLARHLCRSVEALAEPHPTAAEKVVTVSIGTTAIVPTGVHSLATFSECADIALYRAKRSGRNRVEVVLAVPGAECSP